MTTATHILKTCVTVETKRVVESIARQQQLTESAWLEFHGVRIIAVSDGYDSRTKTATRKIQRGLKNLINEMRLDELREQVHRV
jgi:hypothetical protein